MMRLRFGLMAASMLIAACGQSAPPPPPPPAFVAAPHANLAQLMRAIPFTASNIIFDTQTIDPALPPPRTATSQGATATFASVYGGWQHVENSALAISETANLLLIPGRLCENGRPAPVEREDYARFAKGLADAGNAAYAAAKSRNLDTMIEVSGTVSEACAACHEVYRDKEDEKDRCIP